MDRLWALKKEFDPFKAIVPGFGAVGILPILRSTFYLCPYCRSPFKVIWGPSYSLLGTGERACWHCKQIFWDGSQEWPEMSSNDRMQYLLPISVAGYLSGFLVVGGLYLYILFFSKSRPKAGELTFFIEFLIPIACWIVFRIIQIFRSVRRYNDRGSGAMA
jgi:hypothetical protein